MSQYACKTVKIKSDAPGHDGHIVINESDFDPEKHELLDGPKKLGIAELRAALTAKGVAFDAETKKADLQALLDASA